MGITHTCYKCTTSNRLETNNYSYKITSTLFYKASFVTIKNKYENELIEYTQFKRAIIIII